ncbi:MAG: Slp family lipoprotein [Xanthomonadales bacterium]|nr:Outer membrane protein slp [Xanthomonadales bacterium]MCC6592494.1 Slp family lipoprotein [Xanthomonadales bacterium]
MKIPALVLALSSLAGCASMPTPLQGDYDYSEPREAARDARVRWGGRVIGVQPAQTQTCIDVLGLPLDERARPRDVDADIGRFRACQPGFVDPAVFVGGREVTVTGQVEAQVEEQIGEYRYRMPQVRIGTLFLWPERQPMTRVHLLHDPYFFGPWPWSAVPVPIYRR